MNKSIEELLTEINYLCTIIAFNDFAGENTVLDKVKLAELGKQYKLALSHAM